MKKSMIIVVALVFLLVALVGTSSAAVPGSGWWVGAVHQNVGDSNATLSVTAYDSQTSNTYTYNPSPLAPGASFNVSPDNIPGLPAGFVGSIVTSSDQPLVAQVNVTNRQAGSNGVAGGLAAGIYNGTDGSTASTSLTFPLVKNGHFNKTTTFYLQNAGSSAATISVVFAVGGTNYPYTSPSIGPGQMVAVDPGLAGVPSGNGNVGAMTATSAQPMAGVMLEHETTASVAKVLQASNAFAPGEVNQTLYCPTFKQGHFGRSSGIQVQNTHTSAQNVTVTYVGTSGTFVSTVNNLAPGASTTFINDSNITSGTIFAATVEGSAGPVAAIVNEAEIPLVNPNQTATTYNCQSAATATTKVTYPAFKENRFGRLTALQIQNVGGSQATNVVLSFTDNNGATRVTNAQTISAGASSTFVCVSSKSIWNGSSLAANTLSGVTITADQPIIAIANEASWANTNPCTPNNGAGSFDKATANGFNVAP